MFTKKSDKEKAKSTCLRGTQKSREDSYREDACRSQIVRSSEVFSSSSKVMSSSPFLSSSSSLSTNDLGERVEPKESRSLGTAIILKWEAKRRLLTRKAHSK